VGWRLTIRHGPKVDKESFDSLDEALAEARERLDRVRRQGRLGSVSAFRDYTPDQRVQARVEISQKGRLLGGREAGIDLMGNGDLIAYAGAVRKRPLEADSLDDAVVAVRAALAD
jgi:hypothetical protein